MIGLRNNWTWKNRKLFLSGEFTGFGISEFEILGERMYKIKYPDAVLSEDYYNQTRAKDHAMGLASRMLNLNVE